MKINRKLPFLVALVLSCAYASAGNFKVIANPSVQAESITPAELRGVFLEERRSLGDGSHVEPVLAKGGEAHDAFVRQYLGKSNDALQEYYQSLVFTGKGSMPKFLEDDAGIVAYVAHTKGAIGYVSDLAQIAGVKTLAIVDTSKLSQRKLMTRIEPEYPEERRGSNHLDADA